MEQQHEKTQLPWEGTRREFVNRVAGVGAAALAGGSLLAACGGNGGSGTGGEPGEMKEDPLAVPGGPESVERDDVIYPDGYVGPIASERGRIVVEGETARLNVAVPQNTFVGDWEKNTFTKWYAEQTGVEIDWTVIAGEGDDQMTKVNAMIASGDLPDAFMSMGFTNSQLMLFGQQGLFQPLEGYIDEYGVEIKRIFDDYPDTRELMTAPDGHIYSMPYVNDCYHCQQGNRLWLYKPWLDELGMDMPQDLDEFEEVLDAFVNRMGGVPLMCDEGTAMESFIMGSFLYNPGGSPWITVENGELEVAYNKDGWREGLRYMNRLYDRGLLARESFTQDNETLQRIGNNPDEVILGAARAFYWGSFLTIDVEDPDARFRDYLACPTLAGPDGTRIAPWNHYQWLATNHFVVTRQCENPAVAMMWADGQYELETVLRKYSGEKEEGWRYAEQGETAINGEQALWTTIGTWPPEDGQWWNQLGPDYRSSDFRLAEVVDPERPTFEAPLYENTRDAYEAYQVDQARQLPPMWMTEEQAALIGEIQTSLDNHVGAHVARFTLGDLDIDSHGDWSDYLDAIDRMGLEQYLETYQAAYDEKYR